LKSSPTKNRAVQIGLCALLVVKDIILLKVERKVKRVKIKYEILIFLSQKISTSKAIK